ncbi:hypothetical protein PLESTB_001280700 [Pleodorina starrii]|uniref:Uncharacterized protein n=1 Tax=Pleodorina starrii TaxID=330485 RepID=A0A9W6BTT7_9CHLO|nr:hypothetical protein PLESTM_001941800 [Pleodorina starrii]GLC57850.1 hypothetical protein PLESTB_001280700 [Pleodorina starrii]
MARTLERWLQRVCLTAATGDLDELRIAVRAAGGRLLHLLAGGRMMEAAATAGQLASCEWLLVQGCPLGGALAAARRAGQRHVYDFLLKFVHRTWGDSAGACAAACGQGRAKVMEWLRRQRGWMYSDGNGDGDGGDDGGNGGGGGWWGLARARAGGGGGGGGGGGRRWHFLEGLYRRLQGQQQLRRKDYGGGGGGWGCRRQPLIRVAGGRRHQRCRRV